MNFDEAKRHPAIMAEEARDDQRKAQLRDWLAGVLQLPDGPRWAASFGRRLADGEFESLDPAERRIAAYCAQDGLWRLLESTLPQAHE